MNARVLVTAAGSIVAQGIIKSLRLVGRYKIIATDMNPLAAGLYRCDAGVLVPAVSSPDYIESMIRACKDNGVQAVFCGSDDEL
jgi:threonine dehydrogenase-like Zn-dependent dehydrogenase